MISEQGLWFLGGYSFTAEKSLDALPLSLDSLLEHLVCFCLVLFSSLYFSEPYSLLIFLGGLMPDSWLVRCCNAEAGVSPSLVLLTLFSKFSFRGEQIKTTSLPCRSRDGLDPCGFSAQAP